MRPTGLHLLYILYRNRLVQGCPYEVNVTSGSSSSASKVLCSGEGLTEGAVAQRFSVHIDVRRATPGLLLLITRDVHGNGKDWDSMGPMGFPWEWE